MGFLVADWVLAILVTLCALAHIAILRAPDIPESKIIEHIRYIKVAGLVIVAMRFWFELWTNSDLIIPPATEIGLTLFIGAEMLRTVYRLFQAHMDDQYQERARRKGGCDAD